MGRITDVRFVPKADIHERRVGDLSGQPPPDPVQYQHTLRTRLAASECPVPPTTSAKVCPGGNDGAGIVAVLRCADRLVLADNVTGPIV